MPFNKLKKYKLLQNKKYTFPIFVLILFLTFGFFYYFNFLSTRNDETTLQVTVGSAKLTESVKKAADNLNKFKG